jgi:hypothetical protein
LKHGGTEEAEDGEIASNAEIAKKSKLIECHHWATLKARSFTPPLPPLLRVSKVFVLLPSASLGRTILSAMPRFFHGFT